MKTEPIVRGNSKALPGLYKHLPSLALAGGAAFWAANFATSLLPIAAEYRAALSISYLPMILVESLVAGLLVGLFVSFLLLRFSETLSTQTPMLTAEILSVVVLVGLTIVTSGAGSLADPSDSSRYLLIGTVLNLPRFLALGIAVGYVYKRLYQRAA
jgi:hypothetical protein